MKKICLIAPSQLTVPAVLGGAIENLVTLIARANEEENSLDLTILSPYNDMAYIESKNYKNTKFIYIKKNVFYYFLAVFYKFINLIFKTSYNAYNHLCLKKIKSMKLDYIVAEGGTYDCYLEYLKYFSKEQLVLHLHHQWHGTKNIDKTFSKVIGVSKFVVDDFKKTTSIKEHNVLKNGIDLKKFNKNISNDEKIKLRNIYGIKKDDFVILYCGRLIKEKGILELIKAVKEIDNENIKLLIAGSSSFANAKKTKYVESLEQEIIGHEDKIKFTGFINNSELYKIYNIIDALGVPSTWNEPAGLTAIEGMTSKKPLIVTNNGGLPEYISKDGAIIVSSKKNFIDNLQQAILYLYNNPKLRKEMGNINYEFSKKLNYEEFYQQFVEIINDYK